MTCKWNVRTIYSFTYLYLFSTESTSAASLPFSPKRNPNTRKEYESRLPRMAHAIYLHDSPSGARAGNVRLSLAITRPFALTGVSVDRLGLLRGSTIVHILNVGPRSLAWTSCSGISSKCFYCLYVRLLIGDYNERHSYNFLRGSFAFECGLGSTKVVEVGSINGRQE